jgi:hypothetical protein
VLVGKRGIWVVGVSGMGKTERSRNLLVMKRREKKTSMMNEMLIKVLKKKLTLKKLKLNMILDW